VPGTRRRPGEVAPVLVRDDDRRVLTETGFGRWLPPLLLVASALATDVALTMGIIVVPSANDRDPGGGAVLTGMVIALGLAAAALLIAGCVLAMRRRRDEQLRFVRWFTIALLAAGLLGVLPILLYEWMIRRASTAPDGPVHAFRFVQAIVAAYTVSLLITALLRIFRGRLAAAWTTCVCLCLLPLFPLGTVLGVVWLATVRSRETSPS
jgi:hypothetical protein